MFRTMLATAVLAAAIAAQNPVTTTAYPQESVLVSDGNLAPFGCLANGAAAESHAQVLIRPQYLPGPGAVLMGLAVHCQSTLSLTYPSLDITLSPTNQTSLTMVFANNLLAPALVFSATNLTVNYDSNGWTWFPFTTPYVHDGVSGLVIDIRKIVNPTAFATMSTTSNPARTDLASMVIATGTPGSGSNLALVAAYSVRPLAVELQWLGVPTLKLKSDAFSSNGHQFAIGNSMDHTLQGTPGSFFVNLIGLQLNSPPLPLPPVQGLFLVNGPTLNLGLLPPSGSLTQSLGIPANLAFVGLYLTHQSLTVDAVSGVMQFTNATDCFLNN